MQYCTICQDSIHEKICATYFSKWPERGEGFFMYYCDKHAEQWEKEYPKVKLIKIENKL